MVYRLSSKSQEAIPKIFGGGVRYRLDLVTKYPFDKDGMDDAHTTRVTVDKEVFDSLEIGMEINLGFYEIPAPALNAESNG